MHPVQFAERKFVQAASKQASEYVHKGVASFETLIRGAKAFEEAVDHLAKFDAGAASKYRCEQEFLSGGRCDTQGGVSLVALKIHAIFFLLSQGNSRQRRAGSRGDQPNAL